MAAAATAATRNRSTVRNRSRIRTSSAVRASSANVTADNFPAGLISFVVIDPTLASAATHRNGRRVPVPVGSIIAGKTVSPMFRNWTEAEAFREGFGRGLVVEVPSNHE